MPAPSNYPPGTVFGRLTVLERLGRENYGVRSGFVYRCRCECGAVVDVHAVPLKRGAIDACDTCRFTRTCASCGRKFYSRQYRETCSDACRADRKRMFDRAQYYKRSAQDPGMNQRIAEERRQRAAVDPAFAATMREWEAGARRRKARRRREDPAYREHVNKQTRARYDPAHKKAVATARLASMSPDERAAYIEARRAVAREHYRKNKAYYAAKQRRWLDSMSPERLARWMIKRRRLDRERARLVREGIYADATMHERYRAIHREYERRYEGNKRLRELMSLGSELLKKLEQGDE